MILINGPRSVWEKINYIFLYTLMCSFPGGAGDIRDPGSIPVSGRSPGGRHANPFQYSCLENPMDRGVWWATVHRFVNSWTGLK